MSSQSVKLTVALSAIFEGTEVRLIFHMNVRMASEVSFADESLVTFRAFKGLVVSLLNND